MYYCKNVAHWDAPRAKNKTIHACQFNNFLQPEIMHAMMCGQKFESFLATASVAMVMRSGHGDEEWPW